MKRISFVKSLLAVAALTAAGMASAQDIKERTIKFGLNGPEGHPAAAGMKKFAELVQAKSGGKMKVNLFFGATLGSDQAITTSIQGGTVEMSVMNSGILASLVKELAIFDFPFLFANEKESDAIVDGPVGKRMHKLLEDKGVVGLAYWELGYRHITNSKRALNKVEDIDGLKLRVIPNPINVEWVKALGANPTPMPSGEVYTALKTGLVDAAENNIPTYDSLRHFEAAKHYNLTEHSMAPEVLVFSKVIWDRLDEEDQKLIRQAAKDSVPYMRQRWEEREVKARQTVEAGGTEIIPIANKQPFIDATRPVYARFANTPELQALIERIQATQ
jgi:tripartite ATP-independent transporter DctP family solute receptor